MHIAAFFSIEVQKHEPYEKLVRTGKKLVKFDVVGDVHGCIDELKVLLAELRRLADGAERLLVFAGDFVNRGPASAEVLNLVMELCESCQALAVLGNHDEALLSHLIKGLEDDPSAAADEAALGIPPESRPAAAAWLSSLPRCLVLDGGRLIVTHAWEDIPAPPAAGATAVHGHLPVAGPREADGRWLIDTACCFGGLLTAYRHPERETVSVPAAACYCDLGCGAPF